MSSGLRDLGCEVLSHGATGCPASSQLGALTIDWGSMKLSREEILRNILKYKLQQRRRKAAGESLPTNRRKRQKCVGCKGFCECVVCREPALCNGCNAVYRNHKHVRPENKAAFREQWARKRRLKRRGLDADGIPFTMRLTRARKRSAIDLTGDSDGDDAPPVPMKPMPIA